jgi:NAD(P)-dependent dehydrogenase (short-subunit alcohol dehydrogenase family)
VTRLPGERAHNLLVIGATGNVGRAIALEGLRREWLVTAVARNELRLKELSAAASSTLLAVVAADLSDEQAAHALADGPLAGTPHSVVVAANVWATPRNMLDWNPAALQANWAANLEPHLVAARAFIPRLQPGGIFASVGGGTADFLAPGSAHLSLTQSALRMMLRALAKEETDRGVHIKELLIRATVHGHDDQSFTAGASITADEVAVRICDILDTPEDYPETILTLP